MISSSCEVLLSLASVSIEALIKYKNFFNYCCACSAARTETAHLLTKHTLIYYRVICEGSANDSNTLQARK